MKRTTGALAACGSGSRTGDGARKGGRSSCSMTTKRGKRGMRRVCGRFRWAGSRTKNMHGTMSAVHSNSRSAGIYAASTPLPRPLVLIAVRLSHQQGPHTGVSLDQESESFLLSTTSGRDCWWDRQVWWLHGGFSRYASVEPRRPVWLNTLAHELTQAKLTLIASQLCRLLCGLGIASNVSFVVRMGASCMTIRAMCAHDVKKQ